MNLDDHLCGWTPVAHYHWFMSLCKRIIYGRKYSKPDDWFFQDHVLEKQKYREWSENPPQQGSVLLKTIKMSDILQERLEPKNDMRGSALSIHRPPGMTIDEYRELHGFLPLNSNSTVTTTKPEGTLIYGNVKSAKEPQEAQEIADDTKKVGCGGYFALNTDTLIDVISEKQTMQKFEQKLMVNTGEKWVEY
jgi:hypothetical protein